MGLYNSLNESLNKKLNTLVESQENLTEADNTVDSEAQKELKRALFNAYYSLQNRYETNIKAYEIAFQEAIEGLYPDKSWWEVTDCDIFMDLFETRDPWKTIMNIADKMIVDANEALKESNDKDFDKQAEILEKKYTGYKTTFHLRDVDSSEFEEDAEELEAHNGLNCIITGLECVVEPTDPESCYWNIKFEDGSTFSGISGYHLGLPDAINEALKECLRKMNESPISDEDKHDSDIIRNIIAKRTARKNAALTPEEKEIMSKYNIQYDSDHNDFSVDGATINPRMDGESRYSWRSNNGTNNNGDISKINYADRARKVATRAGDTQMYGTNNSMWFNNNRDLNAHVKRTPHSLDSARKQQIDSLYSERPIEMKRALSDRRHAQRTLNTVDSETDAALDKAKQEYEKRVAQLERGRKLDKEYSADKLSRSQRAIDKLLNRDTKEESLKEDFQHMPAKTIQELAEVWGTYDPDYLYYVNPKSEGVIVPEDNVVENIDDKYVYVEGYAVQGNPNFLCTVRIPISEFDKYYTLAIAD